MSALHEIKHKVHNKVFLNTLTGNKLHFPLYSSTHTKFLIDNVCK